MPGLLDMKGWMNGASGQDAMKNYMGSLKTVEQIRNAGAGHQAYMEGAYNDYVTGYQKEQSQGLVAKHEAYGDQMGLLGNDLRNVNSAQNQFNLRNISQQMNAQGPNYNEIAASQGLGGSIAGMQQTAQKRQAGLLTQANFGQTMNDNNKTALGYYGAQSQAYGQAESANQGLLSLEYQDKWKEAELAQQKAMFDAQQGDMGSDLLNLGLGVGSMFLGNYAGAAGLLAGSGGGSNVGTDDWLRKYHR